HHCIRLQRQGPHIGDAADTAQSPLQTVIIPQGAYPSNLDYQLLLSAARSWQYRVPCLKPRGQLHCCRIQHLAQRRTSRIPAYAVPLAEGPASSPSPTLTIHPSHYHERRAVALTRLLHALGETAENIGATNLLPILAIHQRE